MDWIYVFERDKRSVMDKRSVIDKRSIIDKRNIIVFGRIKGKLKIRWIMLIL